MFQLGHHVVALYCTGSHDWYEHFCKPFFIREREYSQEVQTYMCKPYMYYTSETNPLYSIVKPLEID